MPPHTPGAFQRDAESPRAPSAGRAGGAAAPDALVRADGVVGRFLWERRLVNKHKQQKKKKNLDWNNEAATTSTEKRAAIVQRLRASIPPCKDVITNQDSPGYYSQIITVYNSQTHIQSQN